MHGPTMTRVTPTRRMNQRRPLWCPIWMRTTPTARYRKIPTIACPEGNDWSRSDSNCSAPGGRIRSKARFITSLTITPETQEIARRAAAASYRVANRTRISTPPISKEATDEVKNPITWATSTGQPSGSAQPRTRSVMAWSKPSSTCEPVATARVSDRATAEATSSPTCARRRAARDAASDPAIPARDWVGSRSGIAAE